eukprot:CAMPEP_0202848668 /NCGR_PEP_ID=MMETSP1389-20130828/78716_1 /ASSEMBLY_ACC=CAM_ASM_000865 /TAXON_ID=302021 /ORGANISM="Rhodomonas sp., Strain CCMP768" /LENGTH=77 /DNA_ID=CAMNT_0049526567 /DNA_START=25 /DNA_END=255 /DNA_ORIENTATION=+
MTERMPLRSRMISLVTSSFVSSTSATSVARATCTAASVMVTAITVLSVAAAGSLASEKALNPTKTKMYTSTSSAVHP